MKNIILGAFVIAPSLLFSYELEFSKSFSKNIQNDKLSTNISISIDSKNMNFIENKVETFQKFIKRDNTITKKNGNYSFVPHYTYHNNKQKFTGYRGLINYSLETPNYEELNSFIEDLNRIKRNMNTSKVKLSVSNLQWIISTQSYEKSIDSMRIESIQWIKNYSQKLNDRCIIKNISIEKNNNFHNQRYTKNMMIENKSETDITPYKTKKSIVLKANYKLECK